MTEVSEIVGHLLELLTVVGDRKIALSEDVKLGVEVESTCLLVAKEVLHDGDPCIASVGTVGDGGLSKVMVDRAVEPRLDDDIHVDPVRQLQDTVAEDVILQRVVGDGEDELLALA